MKRRVVFIIIAVVMSGLVSCAEPPFEEVGRFTTKCTVTQGGRVWITASTPEEYCSNSGCSLTFETALGRTKVHGYYSVQCTGGN